MDTIIGLGNAGCNIVDKFAQFPQYLTYKFSEREFDMSFYISD